MFTITSKSGSMEGFSLKYYFVTLITYAFVVTGWTEGVSLGIKVVTTVGGAITTWYLIRKYKSDHELNQEKKRETQLLNKKLEIEIEIKERERDRLSK